MVVDVVTILLEVPPSGILPHLGVVKAVAPLIARSAVASVARFVIVMVRCVLWSRSRGVWCWCVGVGATLETMHLWRLDVSYKYID